MEKKDELLYALNEIETWEKNQKDLFIWEKIGRLPFLVLDKVTPKFIHDKIGVLLDEIVKYVDNGGQYLSNTESTLKKASKKLKTKKEITLETIQGLPLTEMDELATFFVENRKTNATIQGATTGFGGIFTLAIDIPFTLGLTLKTLQEVALSYGYDPSQQEERLFIIKCMQFSSSDVVGKKAILEELTKQSSNQRVSQVQGWREVFMTYRDNFGWKKLFQMIPVAGMVFGAFINKQAIADVGEAGSMLYKKRRVLERLQNLDEQNNDE